MKVESTESLPVLIFDGDCGFCTSCVRMASRLFPGRFRAIPWQRIPDIERRFGVTTEGAAAAVQWVEPTGSTSCGHRAVADMLVAAGGPWRPVGRALISRQLDRPAAATYDFVARHRHQLPGGTPGCRMPDPRHGS